MRDMMIHGPNREHEPVGDLSIGQATTQQPEHLSLPRRQAVGCRATRSTTLAGGGDHRLDDLTIQAPRTGFGADLRRGLPGTDCGPVRPNFDQAAVTTGGGKDSLRPAERRPREAAMRPRTIESF